LFYIRPFEWIRNYLNHEQVPVKLVGGGRDKDYGYLGFSHWAEEDIDIMSNFKNIELFKPKELNEAIFRSFIYNKNQVILI
jgi:transketolase C-terminal domain/subunit